MKTVKSVRKLERLLNRMNESGVDPTVAVLDDRGTLSLVYGVEEGDESMGLRVFYSPGDDRERGEAFSGEGHRIEAFEFTLESSHLRPPFKVLRP